ncbi:MAG: ABC transporter substrate-binding protein [Archangiaceae bacterium]|nr:ABC transporter substrate-binding protein [Archangiaceae bacterium]
MIARLVLLALVFAGCSRPDAPSEHLEVGVSLLRISQPVFVAHERGLFATRGLDVELQRFDTAQPFADELAAGRLDAAGYVALPILFSREGGAPRVKLATAVLEDDAHPLSFLLVPKDSQLETIAGLKGRTIGILPTVAYRRWLVAVLEKAGLQAGDVKIATRRRTSRWPPWPAAASTPCSPVTRWPPRP